GQTTRVSVDSSGIQGDSVSLSPSLSADGRVVAFESLASNLAAGDTNGVEDVFVHDRVSGITRRVSVGSAGNQGDLDSFAAASSIRRPARTSCRLDAPRQPSRWPTAWRPSSARSRPGPPRAALPAPT